MKRDYEYIDIKKVLKKLNTSLNGLTNKEANRRLNMVIMSFLVKKERVYLRYLLNHLWIQLYML